MNILDRIKMMIELRRRGFNVDIDTQENKEFFSGASQACLELLTKLQDMRYVDSYIQMKETYMSEEEKKRWIKKPKGVEK